MKTAQVILFIFCLANFSYSQVETNQEEVVLESVNLTHNVHYLNKVQYATMSVHVKELENQVAQCDITKSPKYDGSNKPFKAMFKSSKGTIYATYNKEGKVITTSEEFKNVKLPVPIKNSIFKEHPGWIMISDVYTVSYNEGDVKKVYKVKIGKGKLKKNFRVDYSDTNLLLTQTGATDTTTRITFTDVKN